MQYWAMPAWIFASSAPNSGSAVCGAGPAAAALAGGRRAVATAAVSRLAAVMWRNRRRGIMLVESVGGVMGTSLSSGIRYGRPVEVAGRPDDPDARGRGHAWDERQPRRGGGAPRLDGARPGVGP